MGPHFTRSLVEILRSTLQKVEDSSDLRQDDPAVIELKKHIVRAIAELEVTKASNSILDGDQFGEVDDPLPTRESVPDALTGIEVIRLERPPAAASRSSLGSLASEPAAETTEMPLLAENGTTTSS